jgi:hypothetical protein
MVLIAASFKKYAIYQMVKYFCVIGMGCEHTSAWI